MRPFTTYTGLVVPLDRANVDTDQIIPKQFLKGLTRDGLGRALFYDWRYVEGEKPNPEFVLNRPRYQGASILLARANFGCGSSREHAPWALLDFGIRTVIAPSFADIFGNNCFKNGILPAALPDEQVSELFRRTASMPGYKLKVDLENGTLSDASGLSFPIEIDPFHRDCLLKGLDDVGLTLRFEDQITAYEERRRPQAIMYEPVNSPPASKSGVRG
ncbi:MAG: 3-isopropylmalate dehydratase small subunit [Terriglobia bacterium]